MTERRELISLAEEYTDAGDRVLVSTWKPSALEILTLRTEAERRGARFSAAEIVIVCKEPWSEERLSKLFAEHGKRHVGLSVVLPGARRMRTF